MRTGTGRQCVQCQNPIGVIKHELCFDCMTAILGGDSSTISQYVESGLPEEYQYYAMCHSPEFARMMLAGSPHTTDAVIRSLVFSDPSPAVRLYCVKRCSLQALQVLLVMEQDREVLEAVAARFEQEDLMPYKERVDEKIQALERKKEEARK